LIFDEGTQKYDGSFLQLYDVANDITVSRIAQFPMLTFKVINFT